MKGNPELSRQAARAARGQLARLANRAFDLAFLPGTARLWQRRLRGRVISLLYHRVDEPSRVPFLARHGPPAISPAELARELGFWTRLGARFATFRDLRRGWFPRPDEVGVIVCFDDGFLDNYIAGLSVLATLGIPCTLFQISGLVDRPTLLWEHRLYLLLAESRSAEALRRLVKERAPDLAVPEWSFAASDTATIQMASSNHHADAAVLNRLRRHLPPAELDGLLADTAAELVDPQLEARFAAELYPRAADLVRACAGGHEIASHGAEHRSRHALDAMAFEAELDRSAEQLAGLCGARPEAFSYPFGHHVLGDEAIGLRHYRQLAIVRSAAITPATPAQQLPRCTWPGTARSALRRRRWLLTGHI